MIRGSVQDIRHAVRLLAKTPGFTAVAVLTLGLGIGANTAIFSVVNALLLRPLPYGHPERLVTVWQDMRARGGPADEWATPGNYADWREERALFEELAVIGGWRPTLTGDGEAEPLSGEQVSHEYFSVLGISPAAGRFFTPADDVPNAKRVAVVAERLAARRFGGPAPAVGQLITLSGEPHEVIGVAPAGFRPTLVADADVWRPMRLNIATPSRGAVILRTVARLPADLPPARAQALADALAARLAAAHPEYNEKVGITIIPLHERVIGDVRPALAALTGAVGFVLLIACANIANLLLARASARRRELAIRAALGAGRLRVVRQLLTESIVLACAGGAAGVLLGTWALDALVATAPADTPRLDEISLDLTVLGFAGALTIVTGVLFGLAPALEGSRRDVGYGLKDGGRTAAGPGGTRVRALLIGAEVALALVLLTGGALLFQSLVRLQEADLGFDPRNVLTAAVFPPRTSYDTADKYRAYYDRLLQEAQALPGVRSAALASVLPLGAADTDIAFTIEGRPPPPSRAATPATWYRLVSPDYFRTMGMRIVRGQGFAPGEAAPSVLINETFASRFFPGEDAVGRQLRFGDTTPGPFTIIGVVADVRAGGAREEPLVETYIPYWQMTEGRTHIVLKTDVAPRALVTPLRRAAAEIDRAVPLSGITTLEEMVGESIQLSRFLARLAIVFAAVAALLAALGIYGVMAYAVSQRRAEIGVRVALGATAGEVFRLILSYGLRITAAGVAVGLVCSVLAARMLRGLLYGVRAEDPATFALMVLVLFGVAALACLIPARRAAGVDPVVALRAE